MKIYDHLSASEVGLRVKQSNVASLFFGTFICVIVFFTFVGVRAAESYLTVLSRSFFMDTNSIGFAAFSRQMTFPRPRPLPSAWGSNEKNSLTPPSPQTTYLAYCWSGSNFIIASSRNAPVTNINDLTSADRLYGFDGDSYWEMTLNFPTRTYIKTADGADSFPPVDIVNRLTIIPKDESDREAGRYQTDVTLRTIKRLVMECRRVVQLGYSYPLAALPRVDTTNVILERGSSRQMDAGHFTGTQDHPEKFRFDTSPPYEVEMDYAKNTLIIDGFSQTENHGRVNQTRYQIITVETPNLFGKIGMFSWKTYKPQDGELATEMVKNGATHRAEITTNGSINLGTVVIPAKPLGFHSRSNITIIFFLIVTTAIGAVILLRSYKRNP